MIRILIIGIILLGISCSSPAVEKPTPFIEQDKMVAVLYDFSLLNAISNSQKDYLKQRGIVPVKTIYQWYGIDSLTFAKNDLYYTSKPKLYREIYQRVNDSLESVKEGYDEAVRVELLKRKDSVDNSAPRDASQIQKRKAPPSRPGISSNR